MSLSSLKSLPLAAALATAIVALAFVGATVPVQAQTYTILDNFLTGGPGPQWPGGPLLQGRDGDLYGNSYLGGATNNGSVWKTTPAGTVSVVHSFASGNDCQSGLTLGTDGNFYGSALSNCAAPGYIFKMTPAGVITILHTFTGQPDGSGPSGLVQYTDGNFYGTTSKGGANNFGSVFKITPAGVLTTIYSFDNTSNFSNPTSGLTIGNDGDFYGTQVGGDGLGGIFKITPGGVLTLLHHFTANPDGAGPASGLILGKDGNFYGVTQFGGTVGDGRVDQGTFFKMTPAGVVTILHDFDPAKDYAVFPTSPLIQASDSNFYSTSNACNEFLSCGSFVDIYKVTPTGTLTVVEKLTGANGAGAYWTLTQDTNGTLYGITQQGGTVNGGVYFSLSIGAKAFINLVSTAGRVGSKIGIVGQGFSASSVVKFNGVTATTVTRTGTTFLLATVPAGANVGFVTVTTGAVTLTSSKKFVVHNSWGKGTPMPVAAVAACSAVVNGQIYVVGGYNSSAQTAVQIYNSTTHKWTTGTALATGLSNQACAVVNGLVYEFGGTNNVGASQTNAVLVYNPATKIWSSKSAMPTARQDIVAVVANNLVYVIGGYNGNRLGTLEAYNPATDSWSTEDSLLTAESGAAGGVVAGNIVISGGAGQSTDTGDTESYSVSGNAWTSLKVDATVRNNGCGGVVGAALYVAGGANRSGNSFTVNESFTPSKNAWTTLAPLPQATADPASAVSGGQLFCFGGFTGLGGTTLNNLQIYQP
jgi:uncharacterized repeat protein (TIGR03803 family)